MFLSGGPMVARSLRYICRPSWTCTLPTGFAASSLRLFTLLGVLYPFCFFPYLLSSHPHLLLRPSVQIYRSSQFRLRSIPASELLKDRGLLSRMIASSSFRGYPFYQVALVNCVQAHTFPLGRLLRSFFPHRCYHP